MMKNVMLLFYFLFSTALLNGQTDYRKLKLITNSLDTISGYGLYTGIKNLSENLYFKTKLSDKKDRVYLPSEIKGFIFTKYHERFVSINDSKNFKIFAEIIVQGDLSLYRTKNSYFLENRKYGVIEIFTNTSERNYSKSQGKLNIYIQNCTRLKNNINKNKFNFNLNELTELVIRYNKCISPENSKKTITYNEKKLYDFSVNVLATVNYSMLKLLNYNIDNVLKHQSGTISPVIGVEYLNKFPRIGEYFNISVGVNFGFENYLIQSTETNSIFNMYTRIRSKYVYYELPILVNSMFIINRTKFNFGVGVSHRNIFVVNQESFTQYNNDLLQESYTESNTHQVPFYDNINFILLQAGIYFEEGLLRGSEIRINFSKSLPYGSNSNEVIINSLGFSFNKEIF